jgi:FXSXX-COOH protein
MSQESTTPEDVVLDVSDLDLRQLDELGDTVLSRAVATVVAMADHSTQAFAGFSSRVPRTTRPGTSRPTRSGPRSESTDRDEPR